MRWPSSPRWGLPPRPRSRSEAARGWTGDFRSGGKAPGRAPQTPSHTHAPATARRQMPAERLYPTHPCTGAHDCLDTLPPPVTPPPVPLLLGLLGMLHCRKGAGKPTHRMFVPPLFENPHCGHVRQPNLALLRVREESRDPAGRDRREAGGRGPRRHAHSGPPAPSDDPPTRLCCLGVTTYCNVMRLAKCLVLVLFQDLEFLLGLHIVQTTGGWREEKAWAPSRRPAGLGFAP